MSTWQVVLLCVGGPCLWLASVASAYGCGQRDEARRQLADLRCRMDRAQRRL